MTPESGGEPALVPSAAVTLRRLFLTLFLRGRSARGLRKSTAPRSVGGKLGMTLFVYALFGFIALGFIGRSVFALSATLHAITFLLLGMFVAASSGEILFNQEEADILLHRPVTPRSLLTAKVVVLLEVSLWLAGALNLIAFFVGALSSGGGWLFPIAHALSIALEAIFATSCVVVVYQLCLRWFGRERLDGLMTAAQIAFAISATLGGQFMAPLLRQFDRGSTLDSSSLWLGLAPPVWFAAFDDAVAGSGAGRSWALAGVGLSATLAVAGVALGKLAGDYQRGLQVLSENPTRQQAAAERRWLHVLVHAPPLRWWLRDSVSRAAFLLTAAYLIRDRDTKLRLYPGLAPTLVLPALVVVRSGAGDQGGFGLAFAGSMLGMVPSMCLELLKYSQHWRASDIFRVAPLRGPAPIFRGARWAVLVLIMLPLGLLFGAIAWLVGARAADLLLLLPGLLTLPAFLLRACLDGATLPFSCPNDEARAARGSLRMLWAVLASMVVSGLAIWARSEGWLWWLLLAESVVMLGICVYLWRGVARVTWAELE